MTRSEEELASYWKELKGKIRKLLANDPLEIKDLTPTEVRKHLPASERNDRKVPGVYLFVHKKSGAPGYVGRTKDLAIRIGRNHRSLGRNQAPFTRHLADSRRHGDMELARRHLFRHYKVRFLPVPEPHDRAILEVLLNRCFDLEVKWIKEH